MLFRSPDDVIEEGRRRTRELPAMIKALALVGRAHVIAVAQVAKMRMTRGGVAVVGAREVAPRVFPVKDLVEKPDADHPIFRQRAYGIVGRYLLQPVIFKALHRLRAKNPKRVELTDALAEVRDGLPVFAFEVDAARQDIGDLLEHADAILGHGRE